jgi:hypothetical protein
VSSELDRLLRDARGALPDPDQDATEDARRDILAAVGLGGGGTRRRRRALILVVAMLVTSVLLGVTAGSLNAPSVTAAREPAVLGFVPEPGWFALQSPPATIPGQQTAAVAANVPFAADDVENGLVEPSGLPYATLLSLPADGIVLVSTMTPQTVPQVAPVPPGLPYTDVELPLRLRDAMPVIRWGAQVRPDQPMAQYHLSGSLHGYNVDLVVYFGTSRPSAALMRDAQRQLDAFVVRPDRVGPARQQSVAAPMETRAVFDRTYSCQTVILGGVYSIETRAHAGIRQGQEWSKLPYAVVSSGGWAGLLIGYPYARDNSLVWITAGRPSRGTTADVEDENFPVPTGGTVGVNRSLCKPTNSSVPLRSSGLRGGPVDTTGVVYDCLGPRRVLVRIRATTLSAASLSPRGAMLAATNAVASRAQVAVRTTSGKLLAYAEVDASGRSRLLTAKGCGRV